MTSPNQTYRTYQVTIRTRRQKMPEAILRALIAAGLVRPRVDAATVVEAGTSVTWSLGPLSGANPGISSVFTVDNEV